MVDSDEIDMPETERTMEMSMDRASKALEEERLVAAKTPGNLLTKIATAKVSSDEVVRGVEIFDVDVDVEKKEAKKTFYTVCTQIESKLNFPAPPSISIFSLRNPFISTSQPHLSLVPRRRRRLIGHSHFVQDVILSSDGQFALSGSWDGELRLWDVILSTCRFVGHTKDVLSVAYYINNSQIVSASHDHGTPSRQVQNGVEEQPDRLEIFKLTHHYSKYDLVINELQNVARERQELDADESSDIADQEEVELTHDHNEGMTKPEFDEIHDMETDVAAEVQHKDAAVSEVHSPIISDQNDDVDGFGGWDDDM
ncbi:hypothetical protein ACLB2K_020520 [Fragaria x ananassa]